MYDPKVLAELREMPNLTVATPTGAFYVLPEVDHYFSKKSKGGAPLTDSTAFCVALLDETGVALVPGEAFGAPKAIVRSRPTTHDPRPTIHDRTNQPTNHTPSLNPLPQRISYAASRETLSTALGLLKQFLAETTD